MARLGWWWWLVLVVSCKGAGPDRCEVIGEFSLCKQLLNYTEISVTGPCQDDQEFFINSTAWIWALVGESCRNALAQYMCIDTYPPCSGLKPCQSVCLKLVEACDSEEFFRLKFVDASMGGIMNCSKRETSNCYEASDDLDEVPVLTAHCENYTGSICSNYVGYPIYIPHGWTQDKLEETARQVSGILGLVDQTCRDSIGRWACHQAFMPCNDSQVADILQQHLTHNPAYPSFPCQSTCQAYLRDCERFVNLDPRLQANCSGAGSLAGGHQCGIPSPLEDWPMEGSILGVIQGQLVETTCNNYAQTSSSEATCFLPFVKPDGENGGLVRRFFPESECDLPCPASFLFSEDQWETLTNAMGISYISFFLNLFLLITWKSFPYRTKQIYVARFLLLTTILSAVFCVGFWAIPTYAPKRDLRFLQCADNVASFPMGFNFCTLQAIAIYWLTLSLAGWWFIIGLDAYRSAVMDEKLSPDGLKRKRMMYHILGWGLPTFSLFLFMVCGGKLGGDNETALVFCFLGNRSIRETGEWLDYFTFFTPLAIYMLCGCYFITRISITTVKSSRKTRSTKGQKAVFGQILRMAAFLTVFLFVFAWVFAYRIGISQYRDQVITDGFEWARCHFETLGDFAKCGQRPRTNLNFHGQLGFHVVLAMSGVWVFLVWGTDRKVYVEWKSRLKTASWRELVLCKPVRETKFQNSTSSNMRVTQSVDPTATATNIAVTSEFDNSVDELPQGGMTKSPSVLQYIPAGLKRFVMTPYWTQQITLHKKYQVRRYKLAMFLLLVFLFFLILLIALVSDGANNATYSLPHPISLELQKGRGKSLPSILIQKVEFINLEFHALNEDRTHVNCLTRVTTNNPCGKHCPIVIESMSLSMNLLFKDLPVGWMRSPNKHSVRLLPNADGTSDPVVFEATIDTDLMLEMSEASELQWDNWEKSANTIWDQHNSTNINGTWRPYPACAELSASRGCASYGCRWIHGKCVGPSLIPELVPVRPGKPNNMITMMSAFLADYNVTLGLQGLAAARAFGLDIGDIGINLNTVAKASEGLFAQIFALDIPSNAPGGGLTIEVDMNVVNPSVGSIPEVGDMVFEVWANDVSVGEMFVPNATLLAGDNILSGSGVIWPKDARAKAECERMMSAYLSGSTQYLKAKGLGFHPRARYPVRWFADLVSTLHLVIPMTGKIINALSSVVIDEVTLDFQQPDDPLALMTVSAQVDFPFKFPMTLLQVDVEYVLQLQANISIDSASYGSNCECLPPSCLCATVYEEDDFTLKCPTPSDVISTILFASFGQPTGTCGHFASSSCDASNTKSVITSHCLGQNNCTMTNVTSLLFSPHSCGGDADLRVTVRCASTVGVTTDVTSRVTSLCQNRDNCEIPMSTAGLGPDPFVGCPKVLNVSYRCINPKYGVLYTSQMVATSTVLFASSAFLDCEGPAFASTGANIALSPSVPLIEGKGPITLVANNTLKVLNSTLFGEYVVEIVTSPNVTVRAIVGHINATAQTVIGDFKVSGLQLNNPLILRGMEGFPGLTINKLDVTGGRAGQLDLSTTNVINNPASITALMGQVGFSIWYKGNRCGNISHSGLNLFPDVNSVTMPGLYDQSSNPIVCSELLSNYLNVLPSSITLQGEAGLTLNPYLKLAFTPALKLNAFLPGMTLPRMIIKTFLGDPSYVFPASVELDSRLMVENRFSTSISITKLTQTLFEAGTNDELGTIQDSRNNGNNPIVLAPNQRTVSDKVPVAGHISWDAALFIFGDGNQCDIAGTIGVRIGGYTAEIPYNQLRVVVDQNQDCIDSASNCH